MKSGQRWLWFALTMVVAVGVGLMLKFLSMREELRPNLILVGFAGALVIHLAAKFERSGKPPPTAVDWSQILFAALCIAVIVATMPRPGAAGAGVLGIFALGDIVGRWRSKREASVGCPQPPANG